MDSRSDGQSAKSKRTQEVCDKCKQNIWRSSLRDYGAPNGRGMALADALDSQKTKYAAAIAKEILKTEGERRWPPIIRTLMEKIQARLQS